MTGSKVEVEEARRAFDARLAELGLSLPNYDERRVVPHRLPDVLVTDEGGVISTAEAWIDHRSNLLGAFEEQVYGRAPDVDLRAEVELVEAPVEDGGVTRSQHRVRIGAVDIAVLTLLPSERTGPAPVFVCANFGGNHTVGEWDAVAAPAWATKARNSAAARFPMREIIAGGFGLVTFGHLDVDADDGMAGATVEWPATWGSIAAWAWGYSRVLDQVLDDTRIDPDRVVAVGHSRLGKAALWATAQDERFAGVAANGTGCGGAALFRRWFGETIEHSVGLVPRWFTPRFREYAHREEEMPIDQHQLLALIAPRPLYLANAEDDGWADPRGQELALEAARPVFELFGAGGGLGHHLRPGGHDINVVDWLPILAWATARFSVR